MNKEFFLQLVFNASLLLTLALIYDLALVQRRLGRTLERKLPVGLVIGFIGIIVVLASWRMKTGIIFDTRSILLGITGLFFGTIPTALAVVIIAAFRLFMGGVAAGMGVAVAVLSAAIGLFWRYRRRDILADISWVELYLFGMLVHLGMLACTLFLPPAVRGQVLATITLPVLLVYPAVTAVYGKLLANHLKREWTNLKLRESEGRYQNLANVSPVGIFRTDAEGRTTYVNPMWLRIAGVSQAEAMGDGWLDAVHPDDRSILSAGWREMVGLRRPSVADYRFLRPDGSVVWVMGQATPELDARGDVVGYIGTVTDISERKRGEELVRSSLAEKEVLLKEVHHRVKNNLMTMIGLVKMQEAKVPGGAMFSLLRELEGRIRSMSLVHESLYKSGNISRVDLREYIESMIGHIRAQFGTECDIRLRVQAAAGVEVNLDDAVPCGLILNELITNAFKHAFPGCKTHSGSGDRVITVVMEQAGEDFNLTVADNGVGLPAGMDWRTSKTVGLSLVRMLSQQIKATLELDPAPGTAFHLHFERPGGAS